MTCTFFGHRNCPESVKPKIRAVLEELILNEDANVFYVGNNGIFDSYVYNVLKELKMKYPSVSYAVVLAYYPRESLLIDPADTILPDGIEKVPKRFAISYRNDWMINNADCVIAYVTRSYGGAAQFFEKAKKEKKLCINLSE
ncbi:MAG: hypothetical protein IJF69_03100 [Clostridia bacterium]|nr:hypothetical protein [Clostridia bacterium]